MPGWPNASSDEDHAVPRPGGPCRLSDDFQKPRAMRKPISSVASTPMAELTASFVSAYRASTSRPPPVSQRSVHAGEAARVGDAALTGQHRRCASRES